MFLLSMFLVLAATAMVKGRWTDAGTGLTLTSIRAKKSAKHFRGRIVVLNLGQLVPTAELRCLISKAARSVQRRGRCGAPAHQSIDGSRETVGSSSQYFEERFYHDQSLRSLRSTGSIFCTGPAHNHRYRPRLFVTYAVGAVNEAIVADDWGGRIMLQSMAPEVAFPFSGSAFGRARSLCPPCILPMLPIYLMYLGRGSRRSAAWTPLLNTLGFIIGFSLVFVALGASASARICLPFAPPAAGVEA